MIFMQNLLDTGIILILVQYLQTTFPPDTDRDSFCSVLIPSFLPVND